MASTQLLSRWGFHHRQFFGEQKGQLYEERRSGPGTNEGNHFQKEKGVGKDNLFALVSNKDWKTLGGLNCPRLSQSSLAPSAAWPVHLPGF